MFLAICQYYDCASLCVLFDLKVIIGLAVGWPQARLRYIVVFFDDREVSTNKPIATTKSKTDIPPSTGLMAWRCGTATTAEVAVEVLSETSGTGTLFRGMPWLLLSRFAAVPG